jgi:hypothetical protein
MLATGGLGRRVIVIIEILAQHVAAVSRLWATYPDSRNWTFRGTRIWDAVATTRSWVRKAQSRAWVAFTEGRSWIGTKLRIWSDDGNV